ncbi:MAG: hypothetical protein V4608_10905 [Bacteroidota bacterium]
MKNIKDTLTTIAGIVITISGTIVLAKETGLEVSEQAIIYSKVAGLIGVSVLGYFTGKNPDGSKKSEKQVINQIESK